MSKKEIVVVVRDKTAIANENVSIVCGNNDYNVVFQFDDDWKNYPAKTALFVFNDKTIAVPFDGNVCEGVAIEDANVFFIGVYAGDLVTTTPATVNCVRSIRDIGNTPQDPTTDVYDKVMALINECLQEQLHAATKAYVDARTVQISVAISQYTWENLGKAGPDANTQTSWGILLSDLGIADATKYKSMNWSRYTTGILCESGSQTGFADFMEYGTSGNGNVQISSGRLIMLLGAQSPAEVYYDGDLRITLFA